jgi:DNA-binding PadR family transcriptional regulator
MPSRGQKMSSVRDLTLLVIALAAAEGRTFRSDRGGATREIKEMMYELIKPYATGYGVYVEPGHVTTGLRKLEEQGLIDRDHYDAIDELRPDRTYEVSLTSGRENDPEVIRVLNHQEEVIRSVVENHGEPEPPPPPSAQEILDRISEMMEQKRNLESTIQHIGLTLYEVKTPLEEKLTEAQTQLEGLELDIAALQQAAREGEIGKRLGLSNGYYERPPTDFSY